VTVWVWPASLVVVVETVPPPWTVISWAWVIVKVCVCPEFEVVCLEMPPEGGLSTSLRFMVTLWV